MTKPTSRFITTTILTSLVATAPLSASAVDCQGVLAAVYGRFATVFRKSELAVPSWATEGKAIDTEWWQGRLNRGEGHLTRWLQFKDGQRVALDRFVGQGRDGHVFCFNTCTLVIKLPNGAAPKDRAAILDERERARTLEAAGFSVASVVGAGTGQTAYVVKPFVRGRPLGIVQKSKMSDAQIKGLADIYVNGLRTGEHIDLLGSKKDNLIWSSDESRWILVDLGSATAPAYFQPFERTFFAGGDITSTLLIYLENVFAGDQRAAMLFKAFAVQSLEPKAH